MEKLIEKSLVPENELQELWELSGRVKAILAWMEEDDPYIKNNVLAVMLGAPMRTGGSPEPQADALAQAEQPLEKRMEEGKKYDIQGKIGEI